VAWFMVFNATSSFFLGLMWLGLWCLMPLQGFFLDLMWLGLWCLMPHQVFNVRCKWRVMYLT
jgi:hypothetical protein